jgi:hypothetical protein
VLFEETIECRDGRLLRGVATERGSRFGNRANKTPFEEAYSSGDNQSISFTIAFSFCEDYSSSMRLRRYRSAGKD